MVVSYHGLAANQPDMDHFGQFRRATTRCDQIKYWTNDISKSHKRDMRSAVLFAALSIFAAPAVGGAIHSLSSTDARYDQTKAAFDKRHPAISNHIASATPGLFSVRVPTATTTASWGIEARDRPHGLSQLAYSAEPPKRRYEVTAPIRSNLSTGLPKISGPSDSNLPLVVIDPGHGGHDPGAVSPYGGQQEKNLTLAIAKAVKDEILKSGRVRVALTRETDKFVVLQDRYQFARKMDADMFISIHADSAERSEASGGTVYTLSEVASDREAQRLAARENKANIINGVNLGGADANVSSILIDLTQRETMKVSADFAQLLLREAIPNMRIRGNSHRFASFIVLKAPDMPSVLFETGYISNEADVRFLSSENGQRKVARALANAIAVHFARRTASR
jgi:N-acetylmuramoyl-L-alanine amidase